MVDAEGRGYLVRPMGQWNGSGVKVLAIEHDYLSSTPGTHMVEGELTPTGCLLTSTHTLRHISACSPPMNNNYKRLNT